METELIARTLLAAVAAREQQSLAPLLAADASLRLFTWEGDGAHTPKDFALAGLADAAELWIPGSLEIFSVVTSRDSAAIQFRVQSTEGRLPLDINGVLFLEFVGGLVRAVDLHLSCPMPAAERATMLKGDTPPEARDAVVEALTNRWDMRTALGSNVRMSRTRDASRFWTNIAHPGANQVIGVHWRAEDTDRLIEETMDWYRERGLGLHWTVGPYDEPKDLGERLLRRGFLRAGDQALMLRFGLTGLEDIPENSEVEVVSLQDRPDLWETSLQITASAFHWPMEQADNERPGWLADIVSPPARPLMALLNGTPVATANLYLQGGVAYLGGAATVSDYRGRRIYSTLLRRRLERARDEGYEVAMIHAEPMSRRVVSRYGFDTYATFDVYGWMDPMDPEVIRNLVPDD